MNNEKMNILLYIDPAWFLDRITSTRRCFYDHMNNFLIKFFSKDKIELKAIVNEIIYSQKETLDFLEPENIIQITTQEIRKFFPASMSYDDIFLKQYSVEGFNQNEKDYFKNLYSDKLKNWTPDIIFCLAYSSPFLKELYPNSLVLSQENAIFSGRAPFMRTLFYDPIGFGHSGKSFLHKYEKEIRNFKITEEQNNKIEYFKKSIREIVNCNNKNRQALAKYKQQFRKLVLLPLSMACELVSTEMNFKHDYDYATYVMDTLPSDVGVILTQHDLGAHALSQDMLEHFRRKYKNFITPNDLPAPFCSQSLFFYDDVDIVLNTFSTTGFQSLLFDNKVIAMDNHYSHWYSFDKGLENFAQIAEKEFVPPNNFLYWYLTHYCVFEKRFDEEMWQYNYFAQKLEKFRKDGITFDYFNQIEDIDELSEYIIDYVKNSFAPSKKRSNHLLRHLHYFKTSKIFSRLFLDNT